MGVDFFLKDIALESDLGESSPEEAVRVQLWDIAGQDRAKKVNRVSMGSVLYVFTPAACSALLAMGAHRTEAIFRFSANSTIVSCFEVCTECIRIICFYLAADRLGCRRELTISTKNKS